MASVILGGTHRTAPVRLHKVVGSPVTDRAVRYEDVVSFKRDVLRAKREVLDLVIVDERVAADK